MKILRSLGFGIFLLVLLFLMPAVFSELATTIVVFLKSAQHAFMAAGILASSASHIIPAAHP
ncbi:MAG: hypothetical protein AAB442_02195 [Patescibacteria group bacterium]